MPFYLSETATIWVGTRDAYGQTAFARHEIPAKHAQSQRLFTDKSGNQALSKAVFYFKSDLPTLNTFVVFGADSSSTPPNKAYEIKAFAATPAHTDMKKAWL